MDTAFFDRIHFYLPGWELGKTRDELYSFYRTDYMTVVRSVAHSVLAR